jgi:hypothetical protein
MPVEQSRMTPNASHNSLDKIKHRSYKDLIYQALSDAADRTISLQELYDWVEKTDNTAGRPPKVWKNGIRQALRDDKVWLCKLYAMDTDSRVDILQDGGMSYRVT